jgi:poly-gamma-glutamate synthesis protein (capsule biosynthesis protein)
VTDSSRQAVKPNDNSENGPMKLAATLVIAAVVAGCAATTDTTTTSTLPSPTEPAVRVLLVGDLMAGRGLADLFASEPGEMFAGVRHLLTGADLAAANLESPLTTLPHISANENELEADPAAAVAIAAAGFDLMSLPNNHSTDAGPEGLVETIEAVTAAGMITVGAGSDIAAAAAPAVVTVGNTAVGFLAYDATGVGTAAQIEPGVSAWDEAQAVAAVTELRQQVDVVIVSVHGGTEYLPVTDPGMAGIAETLAAAGADVVWGHGAHVVQPVSLIPSARPTVAATSLGNFLFDQGGPDRTTGYMLELLLDSSGVVAYRVGVTQHPDRRIEFVEWLGPESDAVWLHDSWWTLARPTAANASTSTEVTEFRFGDLVAAARGDVNEDGTDDVVVSFRRPHRSTPLMETHPEVQWADAQGRSAHLGVYQPEDLREIWVAGTVRLPIAGLQVCDGSLAVVHDQLDDPELTAAGAWVWNGFGFDTAPDIPGPGTPACSDVDGDGATEPVILDRG